MEPLPCKDGVSVSTCVVSISCLLLLCSVLRDSAFYSRADLVCFLVVCCTSELLRFLLLLLLAGTATGPAFLVCLFVSLHDHLYHLSSLYTRYALYDILDSWRTCLSPFCLANPE